MDREAVVLEAEPVEVAHLVGPLGALGGGVLGALGRGVEKVGGEG